MPKTFVAPEGPEAFMYALAVLLSQDLPLPLENQRIHDDICWFLWTFWRPPEHVVSPHCPYCWQDWVASRPYCPHCDLTDYAWPPERRENLLGQYLWRFARPRTARCVVREPLRSHLTTYQLDVIDRAYVRASVGRSP